MNALALLLRILQAYTAKTGTGGTIASDALSIAAEVAKVYAEVKAAFAAKGEDLDAMLESSRADNEVSIHEKLKSLGIE